MFTRLLAAVMLTAVPASIAFDSGHVLAQGRTIRLTFTEHRVLKPMQAHGQRQCAEGKQGVYYSNGTRQTGQYCEEYGFQVTGHALVNAVEVVSHLTDFSYWRGKNNCGGGKTSGHYTFGNGPDGFDVVGIYTVCTSPGNPNQYTGTKWYVITEGYGRYLGAGGQASETFSGSVLPQKAVPQGQTAPPSNEIMTSKVTYTITLVQ